MGCVNVGVWCLVGFCVCGCCNLVLVWIGGCGGFAVMPGVVFVWCCWVWFRVFCDFGCVWLL